MYHVESSPSVKLSYLLSPGLLNLFLPKFDIEISSIPKSLGVNIQIQIVVKDVKASKSDYFKNYFLCNKKNMKN